MNRIPGAIWKDVDIELRQAVERTCTDKEIEALELHLLGKSYREIARTVGVRVSTAYDRVQVALDKIGREMEAA